MKLCLKAKEAMQKLIDICQLAGYIQIVPDGDKVYGKEMAEVFSPLVTDNFKVLKLGKKEDVWPQFSKLFGGKYDLK